MRVFAAYKMIKGVKCWYRGNGWNRGYTSKDTGRLPRIFTSPGHIKNSKNYNPNTTVIVAFELGEPVIVEGK